MWFLWRWIAISEKELPDVVFHGELSGTGFLVPLEINACLFLPFSVVSDRVVFLKGGEEMLWCCLPTYLKPKSSTVRQNMTRRHLCSQSPGVVAD